MKITVVIPCRNEVLHIKECIDAIYSCSLPNDAEVDVFVVDGMSDDGTRDQISRLQSVYPTLQLVDNKKQLTPFAFNLGIYAGGKVDFVQIVGARHILSKNYLFNSILKLQSDEKCWCVGGKIINEFINQKGAYISKAMSTSFGMGLGNFRTLTQSGYTDTVTSPMYPYWVFEKIGFFDEELIRNQDDDFNYRVTSNGGRIYYDNDINLKYYVRGNYKGLWRQFFQYGYWKVYVNKKHRSVTTLRQLVPPFFVLYLLSVFLIAFIPKLLLIGIIPLLFYFLLTVFYSAKVNHTLIGFFHTLVIYPILHVSYGLGYLKGLIEFLILKKKPSKSQTRLSR